MRRVQGWKLIVLRMVVALLSILIVYKLDQNTGYIFNELGKGWTLLIIMLAYCSLFVINFITCIRTSEDLEDEVRSN